MAKKSKKKQQKAILHGEQMKVEFDIPTKIDDNNGNGKTISVFVNRNKYTTLMHLLARVYKGSFQGAKRSFFIGFNNYMTKHYGKNWEEVAMVPSNDFDKYIDLTVKYVNKKKVG